MTEENLPGMGPIQSAWVRALESGKYEQTSGKLKNGDGFCCLGVACNLVDPNAWFLAKYNEDGTLRSDSDEVYAFETSDDYGTFTELPPVPIWNRKLKLRTNDGQFQTVPKNLLEETKGNKSLVQMNDAGFTFEEIAKIIRMFPAMLFYEEA